MRTNIWGASNTCHEISFSPQNLIQATELMKCEFIISKLNMVKPVPDRELAQDNSSVQAETGSETPAYVVTQFTVSQCTLFVESPTSSISVIEYIIIWTTNHSPILLPFWMRF